MAALRVTDPAEDLAEDLAEDPVEHAEDPVERAVAVAFRDEWGQVLATVIGMTGDWELAEDPGPRRARPAARRGRGARRDVGG